MFVVPLYVAVMGSAPTGNALGVKLALPPLESVAVPNVVEPEVNVTVPVTLVVGEATVAVNVTRILDVEGFSEELRVVVVTAGVTT